MLKNKIKLFLFLAMILVISFLPTTILASIDNLTVPDYSKEGSIDSKKYSATEFMEQILGYNVTSQEKEYLGEFTFFAFEDKVPSGNVTYSIQNNELLVDAQEYSYLDKNGNPVVWYPQYATYNGITQTFVKANNEYKLTFSNLNESVGDLNVSYSLSLTIKKESLNTLINAAYNEVDSYVSSGIIEQKTNEYNTNLAAYNQYLIDKEQYELDIVNYNNYKQEYKTWKANYDKYQKYLTDLAQYNTDLEKYNEYLAKQDKYNSDYATYQSYLVALEEYNTTYEAKKAAYDAYLPKKQLVDYRLSIMDLITKEMTELKRTVYWAVMGDTVTNVLARKADLVELNADEDAIDDADAATKQLRTIFSDYFSLETDQARYAYYCGNYSQIKSNLEKLLRSLDKLYRSGLVAKILKQQGKEEKYIILVAQLALVCNAIDDNQIKNYELAKNKKGDKLYIDSAWTIGGKTISEVLGEDGSFEEKYKAYPLPSETAYPDPVEEPIAPTVVENPGNPPQQVKKPVAPTEVTDPGAEPTEVKEPVKPTEVIKPVAYVIPEMMQTLMEVYNTSLVKRNEFSEDYIYLKEINFTKNIWNQDFVNVEFYDNDGTFLGKYITEKGSYIVYDGKVPSKQPDDMYKYYTFTKWLYEDGTELDFNNVSTSGKLHPEFVGTLRDFEIVWFVDGTFTTETYIYGETPSYKGILEKEPSDYHYYVFKSWNSEIVPVTHDFTYIASFDSYPIVPFNGDGAKYKVSDDVITIDIKKYELEKVDISLIKDWFDVDKIIIEGKTYLLSIDANEYDKMLGDGTTSVSVSFEVNGDESQYKIHTYKQELETDNHYEFDVMFTGKFDVLHTYLFYIEDAEEKEARATFTETSIEFTALSAYEYLVYPLYSINVSQTDLELLNLNCLISKSSNEINLSLKEEEKGTITKIIVTNSKNIEIVVENGVFLMPKDDIYIAISKTYIEYLVQFISDGQVISSKIYHYGDTVEVPANPIKLNDEQYEYTFNGWDKEITTVTDNCDYTARFNQTELTTEEPPTDQKQPVSKIKIAKIVIICIGCALVLCISFIVFRKIMKKKKLMKN